MTVDVVVLVAAALVVGTVFALSGVTSRRVKSYRAFFTFAGGVEQGTAVRYSGGPKIGRVEKVQIDPKYLPAKFQQVIKTAKPGDLVAVSYPAEGKLNLSVIGKPVPE